MTNTNQSASCCLNCQANLPESAAFCPSCGQKNTDGKISLLALAGDFFSQLFNLDLSIFPTLRDFFIPGKLTKTYFEGKHKKYISPIRLFLFSTLLLIAILSSHIKFDRHAIPTDPVQVAKSVYHKQFLATADTARQLTLRKFNDSKSAALLDTHLVNLHHLLQQQPQDDSLNISLGDLKIGGKKFIPLRVSREDYLQKTPEELVEAVDSLSTLEKIFYVQVLKSFKESKTFVKYLIGKLLWLAILLIPAHALFFKLVFFRKDKYFVEHLVFQYHAHALLFLLLSFYFLFEKALPESSLLYIFFSFGIYILLARQSVYQLSFLRSVFVFCLLHLSYILLSILLLLLVLVAGFFMF